MSEEEVDRLLEEIEKNVLALSDLAFLAVGARKRSRIVNRGEGDEGN